MSDLKLIGEKIILMTTQIKLDNHFSEFEKVFKVLPYIELAIFGILVMLLISEGIYKYIKTKNKKYILIRIVYGACLIAIGIFLFVIFKNSLYGVFIGVYDYSFWFILNILIFILTISLAISIILDKIEDEDEKIGK